MTRAKAGMTRFFKRGAAEGRKIPRIIAKRKITGVFRRRFINLKEIIRLNKFATK